jgi:tyrosyl-tRNA synthetase
MSVSHDKKTVADLLSRGTEEVIQRDHLEKRLLSGEVLRVKLGIDPTAPDLHLGHTVVLRKFKAFQDAGHHIVLIIGDATAKIGDPSGRSETRKSLSADDIEKNVKTYIAQAGKIIDIKKTEIRWNSEWHEKKGLQTILALAQAATIQQVLKRDDFEKRLKADSEISLLETLYPLMQGYDSVEVKADIELGGTDQKFNLLMGRKVQRHFGISEQDIITLPLLEGTDGVKKMSKSYGNYIGITEVPQAMFGKIMTIPDSLIKKYYTLVTDYDLASYASPYEAKMALGEIIVKEFYSAKEAKEAREEFVRVFSKKERPEDAPKLKITKSLPLLELLIVSGVESKSEARRLISQGAVKINDEQKKDEREIIKAKKGDILRVGKHKFFEII